MRTVVFSDEAMAKKVNERFVSAWMNKTPQIKYQDGLHKDLNQDFYAGYALGNGVTNITAIFATPDGRVLNAIPGYLDVKAFEAEMQFALDLHDRLLKGNWDPELFKTAHAEQAKKMGGQFQSPAHQRLSRAGLLTIDQVHATYFNDFGRIRG